MWHIGVRYRVKKGKGWTWRWTNRWLAHPCADLALPFEVGPRAFHRGKEEF